MGGVKRICVYTRSTFVRGVSGLISRLLFFSSLHSEEGEGEGRRGRRRGRGGGEGKEEENLM